MLGVSVGGRRVAVAVAVGGSGVWDGEGVAEGGAVSRMMMTRGVCVGCVGDGDGVIVMVGGSGVADGGIGVGVGLEVDTTTTSTVGVVLGAKPSALRMRSPLPQMSA
jgi:hypothetical protein